MFSLSMTIEEMVTIDVEKTIKLVCNLFEIRNINLNLKKQREYSFKLSKKKI